MKRIFSVLLALLLAFVVSFAGNGVVMDRTDETRITEAAMGYYSRCGKHAYNLWRDKRRETVRKLREVKKALRKQHRWNPHGFTRRLLLAPLALLGFGFSTVAQPTTTTTVLDEDYAIALQRVSDAEAEVEAVTAKLEEAERALAEMEAHSSGSDKDLRKMFGQRANILAIRKKLAAANGNFEKVRRWLNTMDKDPNAPLVRLKEEGVTSPKRHSWNIPEITFRDMFGDTIAAIVDKMDKAAVEHSAPHLKEVLDAERLQYAAELHNAVLEFTSSGTINSVSRITMAVTRFAECAAADIANTVGVDPGDVYAAGKLRIVHALRNFGDDADKHVLKTAQRLEFLAIHRGVMIDGRIYKLIAATPSQSKAGDSYFADSEFFEGTRKVYWFLGQNLDKFKSNGSEELKRMALAFTPSVVSAANGGIKVNEIAMLPESSITVKVLEALVFALDGSISVKRDYKTDRTPMDGAIYALVPVPNFQARSAAGLAVKGLVVCVVSVLRYLKEFFGYLPETITDIDGHIWALPWSSEATKAKYPVAKAITTTSTWKGKSLGLSWTEAVKRTMALAEDMPAAAYLRVIRYTDASDDRQRKLGRQALQEFISWTEDDLRDLLRKPIGKMMGKRHLVNQMVELGAIEKEERGFFHRLVEEFPDLLLFQQIQRYIWNKTKSNAEYLASARVPIGGDYPYITEDPIVALAHLLYGMTFEQIKESGLFYLKEDEASFAGFDSNRQLFVCRYPLNWFAARLLTNKHHSAYRSLGGVGILSVYSVALIAMDGDVDGDETLVTEDSVVLRLARRMLRMGFMGSKRLPVIVFPHDTANSPQTQKLPFVDERDRAAKLSISLDYSQRYSTVGIYANAAAALMAAAAEAWTNNDIGAFEENALNAAIMHVASILVIDMTKTGEMPAYILGLIPKAMKAKGQMPWCQRFNLGWTDAQFAADQMRKHPALKGWPTAGYLPDAVAGASMYALSQWEFDAEGLELNDDTIKHMLFDTKKSSCEIVVDRCHLQSIIGLKFKADKDSAEFIANVMAGKKMGIKDILVFFWQNESALKYKVKINEDDLDLAEEARLRLNELHILVYNLLKSSVVEMFDEDYWESVVNFYVDDALKPDNKVGKATDPEDKMAKQARYAMFVLEIFSPDLLANVLARM